MLFILRIVVAAFAAATFASAHSVERNRLRRISRVAEVDIHTASHRLHALTSFELTFALAGDGADGQRFRFSLEPNHDIIPDGATIDYLDQDGRVTSRESINRLDHRVYRGNAFSQQRGADEWHLVGWARITIHRDGEQPIFDGAFRVNGDNHHILTSAEYGKTRRLDDPVVQTGMGEHMVIWRDSDVVGAGPALHDELRRRGVTTEPMSCSSDNLAFNIDQSHPVYSTPEVTVDLSNSFWRTVSPRVLFGRQIDGTTGGNSAGINLTSSIGSTAGCPTTHKVALVGIATDCSFSGDFQGVRSDITTNLISVVNSASQVYESNFNISLGIHQVSISNESCPTVPSGTFTPWNVGCSDQNFTINDRLNLFSEWRGQQNDSNAYWSLFSQCNTGSEVGLSWLGQLCVQGAQSGASSDGTSNETVASTNVVVRTTTEWQVFAHETGHTFGAVHDCTSQTCSDGTAAKQQCCPFSATQCNANGQFIMNPSTGSNITNFSPCTVGNICSALGRQSVKSSCLTDNKNIEVITGSECGNGIVETGEECDCGGTEGCNGDPCCDASTCKFTTGSVCDPVNEPCCASTCQFMSNGTTCRASTGPCDPAETCTGDSGMCPPGENAPDGTSCGSKGQGLECASGQCSSRNLQCQQLMGSLTTDNDTYACSSQGCQLSCASPEFGANICLTMMQNFLDGTPCQGGGRCNNGNCDGASVGSEISDWVRDNEDIVIPVVSIVGSIIILGIVTCIWSSYRRRNRRKKMMALPPPPPPSIPLQQNPFSYPPTPQMPPPGLMTSAAAVPEQTPPPSRRGLKKWFPKWGQDKSTEASPAMTPIPRRDSEEPPPPPYDSRPGEQYPMRQMSMRYA